MNNVTPQSGFSRFLPIVALIAICWLVFGLDTLVWHGRLAQHGIIPRHLNGLMGIVWALFPACLFQHLAANRLPLLILGGIICGRSRAEFALVTSGRAYSLAAD